MNTYDRGSTGVPRRRSASILALTLPWLVAPERGAAFVK